MHFATCVAPVNIAVIKYWGKRDEKLILPVNDSLSVTLSTDEMCAKTTVAASADFKNNQMWLNGEEVPFEANSRLMRCIKEVQRLAVSSLNNHIPIDWKLHIASENNFPTAAGLASSAAGYACLVYTLACLYGVEKEELSCIARQGSGSACRSMYGGFVQWQMGELNDGSDSIALPIANALHWPQMHVLILVVNDGRKKTSSTKGMQRSVETSELLKQRTEKCVPARITAIKDAIINRDFSTFANITMQDSNQFHAIALDTFPPCVYMNDTSHEIAEFVHNYNSYAGGVKVAYTFDAGPNACLYLLEEDVPNVLAALDVAFPNDNSLNVEYLKGISVDRQQQNINGFNNNGSFHINKRNSLKYIIHTKVGEGPKQLDNNEALLQSNGLPKTTN